MWQDAGLCPKLTVPSELLDKTDVFIFDCDGVIWKGDALIDRVPKVLETASPVASSAPPARPRVQKFGVSGARDAA